MSVPAKHHRALPEPRPSLGLAVLSLALGACLDSNPGTRLSPFPNCSEPVAALAFVARGVGQAAIGRCGHVAVWREDEDRAVEVYGPDLTLLGWRKHPNGYAGEVVFTPSGERLVSSSLESDLGFGSADIFAIGAEERPGRLPGFAAAPSALIPEVTLDFAGPPEILLGHDEVVTLVSTSVSGHETRVDMEDGTRIEPIGPYAVAAERLLYARGDESLEERPLYALDLDTRAVTPIGEIRPSWFEADTLAHRETLLATGDGTRGVIVRECRFPGGGAQCPAELVRVVDAVTGSAITAPPGWLSPKVGQGPLIAAELDDGTGLVAADGTLRTLVDRALVAVLDDHIVVSDGPRLEAIDGVTGDTTPLGTGTLVATSPEGHAALVFDPLASGETRVTLWRAGRDPVTYERPPVPPLPLADIPPSLIAKALFDDGVTLVTDGSSTHVLDSRGIQIAAWEGTCTRDPLRRGRYLFIERCHTPNDLLVRVDLDSGHAQVIAEGHTFQVSVDPTGELVAFTYVPLSGTRRELHAGRVGR